jgi:hypothetical protein
MKQVDHYLRQAQAARELARSSSAEAARIQFEQIAETWEALAKERLSLLQLKLEKLGGDALLNPSPAPSKAGDEDKPSS